ncbi:hypothetical protein B0H63DRAFT_467705 [Podospora didyma]|uniref:Uncharacterized protein n=1 Tax=Podospora didyma TaxID=330526 RepID=A0AAE0P0T9_9PEZI|nr:hypothetical protein B0H63DRAFT_467705 [Podospora didyma]
MGRLVWFGLRAADVMMVVCVLLRFSCHARVDKQQMNWELGRGTSLERGWCSGYSYHTLATDRQRAAHANTKSRYSLHPGRGGEIAMLTAHPKKPADWPSWSNWLGGFRCAAGTGS